MPTKLKVSAGLGILFLTLYWIGVYLNGVPITRGYVLCANYVVSVSITLAIAILCYICPAWKEK